MNYDRRVPKGVVTTEKEKEHAVILQNSVKKKFRHFSRKYRKQNIDCFRLYDWDSPDIRIVVDWYGGHIVVAEYERLQTTDEYLPKMAKAVAEVLNVKEDKVHIKRRRTKVSDGPRYKKISSQKTRFIVNERDLKFLVNLTDFLDTGLYSDHRDTRVIIGKLVEGKDFLNLFAYTGAFTCIAAKNGAKSTTTVDRSENYINWTKDNLVLNGLYDKNQILIQSDVLKYLKKAGKENKKFDLVFLDPPSFFKNMREKQDFDIKRDHPKLIEDTLRLVKKGGLLFFSTNHQRFEPNFDSLNAENIVELTPKTIPQDYRNKRIHRCWRIKI